MKRALIVFLALLLALGLCACKQEPVEDPTPEQLIFSENTSVLGLDMSGLTAEEAFAKLEAAVAGYQLELTVDGITVPVTAKDIDLFCSRDSFMAAAEALAQNSSADLSRVVRFSEAKFRLLVRRHFNKDSVPAALRFDETAGQYVLDPHSDGLKTDPNALVDAVDPAVRILAPSHTLNGFSEVVHPAVASDTPELLDALELANRMIGVQLTYTFDGTAHDIPAEIIRSLVTLGEDGMTPAIDSDALGTYVTELSDKYSIAGTKGSFHTTGGGTIDLTVSYNGKYVDTDALEQDIIKCMQEGISGTREASYQASGNRDMAYGGTYVEVNLSSQRLWFYKNGERLVSTSLVSGKVADSHCTPTGIYSIYSKETNTYLVGADYRSFVYYWMPFSGGYGLHDATWRSSFGGDIYLYSGSHGCVNLPLDAAATIYNNAPVGTKVILYGGKRSVPPLDQKLTGTTSYDVADDVGSIQLNIKPQHSDPTLSYKSGNTKVATVDANGKVTIHGTGTAKITVTVPKHSYYTAATITVTIKVHSACDEGRHTMDKAVTVTKPTCQPGLEKSTCKNCDYVKESELKPTQNHTYGDWVTTKEPTCGAEGTKERTCTICNKKKETGTIPATGNHTEGEWITTKEPTCVDKGSKQTKCTVCGTVIRTESIDATGVHAAGDWTTTKEPTCYEKGTKVQKCKHCKEVLATDEIATTAHPFGGAEFCPVCNERNPNYVPPTEPPTESPTGEATGE